MSGIAWLAHLDELRVALHGFDTAAEHAHGWGRDLGHRLAAGSRVLAAGNGGSAAQAQHFTAELVGRYRVDRRPVSAIALHTDTSALTAIANDYDPSVVFARQVTAHGRRGDVALLFSTSGRSPNLLAAARAARAAGMTTWALTGPVPNPLADLADDTIAVPAAGTPTVQELHLVALHVICAAVESVLLLEVPARVTA
jgi:D-sedoheptulose 7-phosphate isomerase